MLGGLARELGSWELGPQLAWAYLHTDEHLAQLAEQLTALAPPQLELQLLAEAGDSRQLDLGSAGAGGVAGGVVQQLTSSLGEYSARHCPDTRYQHISTVYLGLSIYLSVPRTVVACVDQFRAHLTTHGEEEVQQLALPSYNLLRLNTRWGIISILSRNVYNIYQYIYYLQG